ncbi:MULTISPECIES: hypothetical protein [Pseudanabaena]|uniref:WXG100 family type VII secretion target n=2 Tax=Pseudanabaena TaxID=1152 RepID=L8N6G8_9CYAN|nr:MULTISPECIES: hypothetical protein [Pseudanabaena]ELS33818.1 hypothetical protein Pse7429DRAFT_1166 [Pseudanabaena biceps PCC 7429]MDG3493978.1 hypothetical protein [Pseudanabaena catenata USMAC16]
MATQTKFDIEEAKELSRQLQNLRDVLDQEFSRLINQWHNLESTWRDDQYSDFVHDFWEEFLDKTKTTIKIYEKTSEYLDRKIQITEQVYGLGAISEILTAKLPIQMGSPNSTSASSQSAPNNPRATNDSSLENLLNSINNGFYQAIANLRKGTASGMIFTTIFLGGLMKNYDEIIAPAIAVYDEMIAKNPNLPEDSAPKIITKISDDLKKEIGLSSDLEWLDASLEKLDASMEISQKKKDEEDERNRKLLDYPEITGGK